MMIEVTVRLTEMTGEQRILLTGAVAPPNMTLAQYMDYWLALVRTEMAKAPLSPG